MPAFRTSGINPEKEEILRCLKQRSYPLHTMGNLEPLLQKIGSARIVMLGEASHGTHEYYRCRSYITQRLIREKGFNLIAVEGDWPDSFQVNRYIRGWEHPPKGAFDILRQFNRWPTWLWANWETVALAEWLRKHNDSLPDEEKTGFYGLDVYSLWESMEAIMAYLEKKDPESMQLAEQAYACFEPYRHGNGQQYAKSVGLVPAPCENDVVNLLHEIRKKIPSYNHNSENAFSTEQNALIAVGAEKYYRAMIRGGPHSWNVRDRHMADTLERLLDFHGPSSKIIVWAHNTHIGDARATNMASEGMFNLGELARVHLSDLGVVLVGFGSYQGTVMAGRRWGAPMQKVGMPPAREGSWEQLLHETGGENRLLLMDELADKDIFLEQPFDHRAIGVVYNPQYEPFSNYVPSILPLRYDAFVYFDETNALHPLHIRPDAQLIPETYPFGV